MLPSYWSLSYTRPPYFLKKHIWSLCFHPTVLCFHPTVSLSIDPANRPTDHYAIILLTDLLMIMTGPADRNELRMRNTSVYAVSEYCAWSCLTADYSSHSTAILYLYHGGGGEYRRTCFKENKAILRSRQEGNTRQIGRSSIMANTVLVTC